MKNPVTWFEIIGKDGSTLHKFYGEVFGWKLTPPVADMGNYSMLAEHGPDQHGAGGGIGAGMQGENRVSIYVEVDDPQKYLDRAAKAGAMVLMPVTTITPTTTIAMFRDPAGNTTGIMKANPRPARAARPRAKAARPRAKKKPAKRARSTTAKRAKRTTKRTKRR